MEFNIYMKKMFGQRLRELRTAKKLTQETVAELIDIKPENYSRIENGLSFPKPENIVKLSKVLDVEIAELFQFSHLNDYEKILDAIIEKLKSDKETTVITYKFLKSLGKL
jgi:transcriptional regulator with XRE-family HTH domain